MRAAVLILSVMHKINKTGVTGFVLAIKHVKKHPDFEKLAHVAQCSIQSFRRRYQIFHEEAFESVAQT